MNINNRSAYKWFSIISGLAVIALTGCSGDDGESGAPGTSSGDTTVIVAPPGGVASATGATALSISITGVTVSSPPVVNFSIANQDGVPVAGLTKNDLRFNIAKLIPGTNGEPSNWQNYINVARNGAVAGSQERNKAEAVLVDNLDGTYTYTFGTDITSAAANPCPAPCTDANGNPLDISYQPSLPHRVTIQQGNSAYPKYNAAYDFVPSGGPMLVGRDIVTTAQCNECHNQLSIHGSRTETKLCVTCHNPGTWSVGTPNVTADFKVMIHKIHRGHDLPSVVAGGTYEIGGHDYSDVHFPQDIRNCTKCHEDGKAGQGDNWQTKPSIAACGSCHDDIDFSKVRVGDDNGHPLQSVSTLTDSNDCLDCHSDGGDAGSIADKHSLPGLLKAEGAKYKLKIVSVTNTAPLSMPTIRFSITNAADVPYDIAATPAITGGSMSLLIAWNTSDVNNNGRSNSQPVSISLLSSGALAGSVTNNGDGTYSVTSTTAVPADATGSGRAGFHARFSTDVNGDATKETIQVKSVVKDFLITGASVVARRTVVDMAKCNQCHERLSLHGGARTDEPQLCVMCHNPNATDVGRRPKTGGIPVAATMVDLKKEESIDFKTMIHGIHASAQTHYDGSAGHGFREKGLVVYGFFSAPATQNPVDFSHVRFPGVLKDCAACHTGTSYQLTGRWESPSASGILGTTIDTAPSAVDDATLKTGLTDQSDDLNISPTAAVCSSCHDSTLAKTHMTWGTATFSATEATINTNLETCSICHGPGSIADVKTVHGVK
jgi:OmcA/MtrC family decaheme c-type cytochrome